MLRTTFRCVALLALAGRAVLAQQATPLSVRTFTLHNLRAEDAAKLVSPYVQSRDGGVFDAGSMRAITVKETPQLLARIDSLLRAHDRPRVTLTLRFQLIAAYDTAVQRADPAIASVDAALRGLFRFAGYKLVGDGVTTVEESQAFEVAVSVGQELYAFNGWVENVVDVDGKESVRVTVNLLDRGPIDAEPRSKGTTLLSTGLTMPIGQTILVGSTASGTRAPVLILAVRPELPADRKR
jgi:hypothetical protein